MLQIVVIILVLDIIKVSCVLAFIKVRHKKMSKKDRDMMQKIVLFNQWYTSQNIFLTPTPNIWYYHTIGRHFTTEELYQYFIDHYTPLHYTYNNK